MTVIVHVGAPARAAELAADPSGVTEMEDHALLHGSPAARDRFDFLLRPPAGTAAPTRPDPPEPAADLRDDLPHRFP